MTTEITSWGAMSLITWNRCKRMILRSLHDTLRDTSRLVSTMKTWKICTWLLMLPFVLTPNVSVKLTKKDTFHMASRSPDRPRAAEYPKKQWQTQKHSLQQRKARIKQKLMAANIPS